ncbi:MAG: tetratricopeptide repeat protein [Synechococcales cyanobacterium CRU_2_2]|nr:tetratricopeptide repeat protein [Synechococcales cyanobacterium CRU_2_2]
MDPFPQCCGPGHPDRWSLAAESRFRRDPPRNLYESQPAHLHRPCPGLGDRTSFSATASARPLNPSTNTSSRRPSQTASIATQRPARLTMEQHFNRGFERANQGDYAGAIADFTAVSQIIPSFSEAYFNRGLAKDLSGDPAGAIADYSQTIALNPRYSQAYTNRGAIYLDSQQLSQALADFDQAIRLDRTNALAWNNRGNTRLALNQFTAALQDYGQAIALSPWDATARFNRGTAYLALGQQERAIADFTAALRLNPNYAKASQNLKLAQELSSDLARAPEASTLRQ